MKVASFNVNSLRARLAIVIEWLKKESPDVLCIQETKVVDSDFPRQAFADIYYDAVFRGEKTYNGVAIISRHPIENVRFGFDNNGTYGTRLVTATIKNIPVINTYIPQGFHPASKKFREKIDWFHMLHQYMARNFSPRTPLLWVGDFNVAPEAIDVYDPVKFLGTAGYHLDEHAALQKCREWGLVDVFREHEPGLEQYTFWDYRIRGAVKNSKGWRIDHIWATEPLAEKSLHAWIDIGPRLMDKPSDHTPVVAEFDA